MDTIRRVFSAVNKRGRRVWKSVKKNRLLSCFRVGRRSKSPKPTKCTVEISDDGTNKIMLYEKPTAEETMADNGEGNAQVSVSVNSSKEEANEPTFGEAEIGVSEQNGKKKRRSRAKRRKNAKSQEATQTLQEGYDKKIVENDETKSLDQPPRKSLDQSSVTKSNIDEEKTTKEFVLDVAKGRDNLDMAENVLNPAVKTEDKVLANISAVTKAKNTETAADGVENVTETDGRGQTQPPPCSKTSRTKKKKTDRVVKDEMDPAEMNDKIQRLCSGVIKEYEQLHNLDDVIYLLVEDEKSVIRMRHQDFVTSTLLATFDDSPNTRTEAGKLLAELLSKNVLNMTDITRGIDAILKEWNDYLMDYPHFFSYVAAIVAPLLTAKIASFGFCDLKQACSSIRPNNSSTFFAEVMQTILRSENAVNTHNDSACEFIGALRTYDIWRGQVKHVPLDVFMPDNQINKFFKNDQLGVLLLAMSMHKTTKNVEGNKSLYSAIHKWIKKNIDANTVRVAGFVRSLTVATAIVCSSNIDPNMDFFDRDRSKLIKNYVLSECDFTKAEIQEREIQCIRGIREISATFHERQKSEDMESWKSRLLCELCRVGAISTISIDSCPV